MKKLTAKQRAKIYRGIADEFERNQSWESVCVSLYDNANDDSYNFNNVTILLQFPEFGLFKPDVTEFGSLWWGNINSTLSYDLGCRITALLLCEQMALNP